MTAPQADAHAGAACAKKCIGVISYVQMQIRFVMRIRMRLTESVHVAIQNVSAHESDKYSKSAKPDNCVDVESGESSFGQHDVSGAEFSLVKTIVAFCHCVARRAEPDVHRSSCGHAASSAPGS